MDEYDAFSGGVEPGGLRTRGEIKTLICYLVRALEKSLSREQISEIMQSKGIANYFDVNESMAELISNGMICVLTNENLDEVLAMTTQGLASLTHIENEIPRSIKEEAVNEGVRLLAIARNSRDNRVKIYTNPDGCTVVFGIYDGEREIMKLSLFTADITQANMMKDRFLEDPVSFYSNLVSKLF